MLVDYDNSFLIVCVVVHKTGAVYRKYDMT